MPRGLVSGETSPFPASAYGLSCVCLFLLLQGHLSYSTLRVTTAEFGLNLGGNIFGPKSPQTEWVYSFPTPHSHVQEARGFNTIVKLVSCVWSNIPGRLNSSIQATQTPP